MFFLYGVIQGPLRHFESGWASGKKNFGGGRGVVGGELVSRSVCVERRNSKFTKPLYIIYDKKVLFSGSLCM